MMQHHLGLSPVSFCPITGRFSSPRAELWLTVNPLGQHKPAPPETTENFVVIFREKKKTKTTKTWASRILSGLILPDFSHV